MEDLHSANPCPGSAEDDEERIRAEVLVGVELVFDGDVVAFREGAEAVDALDGAVGGNVKGAEAAGLVGAEVGYRAVALDVEDNGDALSAG